MTDIWRSLVAQRIARERVFQLGDITITIQKDPIGPARYAESLPAIFDHFRHERHSFQLRVGVEGGKNLAQTANGDGLAAMEANET